LDLVTKRHPNLIIKFGGHAMAAGLSILEKDFAQFQSAFETVARELLNEADLQAFIETDGNLDAKDMSLQAALVLASSVWGQGFPQPLFNDDFKVINQRIVGEKHLKLILEKDYKRFDAIYFNSVENLSENISAVYALDANEYKGLQSLQLQIKHIEMLK
jgi:single-stranded-DNA-specific exonuclease